MLSHSDQCSHKTYKCEFPSYPHAEHINQRRVPREPDLIHIPAGLLQRGAGGDKAGSICRAGKNTASATAWHIGDD